jgi:Subtilase family.
MPDRPLLLLPRPEVAEREKLPPAPTRIHRPTHGRQGQRLSPVFTRLRTEFAARRAELQQTAAGADPEQVLVIETIGNVEDFANAVRRVDGFEWMGEIETDEIAPDEDFYDEQKADRPLSGRLYLVMTNQRALEELVSLWASYQSDPNMTFAHGLTKFRDVFRTVKDIRRWGVEDRLLETGVLDAWRDDLKHHGDQPIRFEVELWYRSARQRRETSQAEVRSLIEDLGGQVTQDTIIEDISYHALLAELPRDAIEHIIEHPDVELGKADSVMFFRPVGQMATGQRPIEGDLTDHEPAELSLPAGDPAVAILDGLPLANHSLLVDRLIIDDADDCASEYTVLDRMHGTAMASLVVHGDLSERQRPLSKPVYVRPIMKPIPWIRSPRPEQIPGDVLVVDYIYRAVRRMFEGEGTTPAVAPTVRIINFSIGDPSRQFVHAVSPLARLLDWLSVKYGVVFVISAGNHANEITLDMSHDEWNALPDSDKEAAVVRAIYHDARNQRLLSPAESINGITVGALHRDSATIAHMDHSVNLFSGEMPSPVSAFGSGYRRSIKPDLIFDGGRVLHSVPIGNSERARFEARHLRIAPGQRVASPSDAAGDVTKVAYCCGTSNASALVTRQLAQCYDVLLEVLEAQGQEVDIHANLAALLKAMIIHGCSWGDLGARLQEMLRTPENSRHIRSWIARWMGYGVPDCVRVMECTAQRATMIGYGALNDGEAHVYRVPLPPSLGSRREWRRVTATCAWLSPIACSTQRYRMASIWFELGDGVIASDRKEAEWRAVRRGTVQHEVFEGEQAVPINDGDALEVKVNCRKDASTLPAPVPYGMFVTIEVADGVDIAIYDEIRVRVATAVEIRARDGG